MVYGSIWIHVDPYHDREVRAQPDKSEHKSSVIPICQGLRWGISDLIHEHHVTIHSTSAILQYFYLLLAWKSIRVKGATR